MTLQFSRSQAPLVAESLPTLTDLQSALGRARDDAELPRVIRVAAHAAQLVAEKYNALSDECEVYKIAIGKCYCPSRRVLLVPY